jgi:hypothetical protein
MTEREDHEQTTADLVEAITRSHRAQKDAEPEPAEGQPPAAGGSDVEAQADALADDAARLGELLTAFTSQPRRSLDAIAVFRDLSQAAGSIAGAAAELRRQEWFDLDDDEGRDAWDAALAGLRAAEGTFAWAADGWI